jgi:hypothetical protein
MQISKKSSYLSDKMHLEKVTGKNVMKNLHIIGPLKKG